MRHRQDIMISAKQAEKAAMGTAGCVFPISCTLHILSDKVYLHEECGEFSNHMQKCEIPGVENVVVQRIAAHLYI